jgi:hypothetical protein
MYDADGAQKCHLGQVVASPWWGRAKADRSFVVDFFEAYTQAYYTVSIGEAIWGESQLPLG